MKKCLIILVAILIVITPGCKTGPRVGGVVKIAGVEKPNLLNPLLSSNSGIIEASIFQGLVRYDENMELVGQLAQSWDVSSDFLEWTFYLRDDVSWHDGQPFTAADVEFTITTLAFTDALARTGEFYPLDSIEVIDDYTVSFRLKRPYAPFLDSLCQGIVASHIFAVQGSLDIGELASHPANYKPVGTGPYVLVSWNEDSIVLEHNQDYYGHGPYIETVIYKFMDTAVGPIALAAGDIDILLDVPCSALPEVADLDSHHLYHYLDSGYEFLGLNFSAQAFVGPNPWQEPKVREALAYAIDRETLVEELLAGKAVVLDSPVPPQSWAYAEGGVEHDLELAGELLDQAGWRMQGDGWRYKEGYRFSFQLLTRGDNPIRAGIVAMLAEQLKDVGIEVVPKLTDWNTMLVDYVLPGEYQGIIWGWSLGPNLNFYDIFHSSGSLNFGSYSNPSLDRTLESALEVVDAQERREVFAKLQELVEGDLPYIFLFSRQLGAVMDKRIEAIVSPLGPLDLEKWHIHK